MYCSAADGRAGESGKDGERGWRTKKVSVRPENDTHGGSAAQAQVVRVVSQQRGKMRKGTRAGQTQTENGGTELN
jgi:hypothetical protein